jgi:hypothetical protein
MFDIEFWKNFLSNLLATFLGLIIGIPVALWINRFQQKATEVSENKRIDLETSTRKEKILNLIKAELEFNEEIFSTRNNDEIYISGLDTYKFKLETWGSISDGGEIQWIQNLDLLNAVSLAYYAIRRLMSSFELFSSSDKEILGVAWPIKFHKPDETFRAITSQHIDRNTDLAFKSIQLAIVAIEEELNKKKI